MMIRACASMMVSIFCALSLTACAAGSVDDGEVDDFEGGEDVSPSEGDTGGSKEPAAPDAEGSGDGPSGDPAIDEPIENGVHITEAAACDALLDAQVAKIHDLKCPMTTRICPSLIRFMTGEMCVEYDEGSVEECVARYTAASTCASLADMINTCAVVPFPGTQSAECI